MAYQYDPNAQNQYPPEGNGMQGPPQPQGMQPPNQMQQQQQQQGQEGGSPAPFAQQGGPEGSSGSVGGEKTTLWYVEISIKSLSLAQYH